MKSLKSVFPLLFEGDDSENIEVFLVIRNMDNIGDASSLLDAVSVIQEDALNNQEINPFLCIWAVVKEETGILSRYIVGQEGEIKKV